MPYRPFADKPVVTISQMEVVTNDPLQELKRLNLENLRKGTLFELASGLSWNTHVTQNPFSKLP